jgi:hypothetical protein
VIASIWIILSEGLVIARNSVTDSYQIIDYSVLYIIIGVIGIAFFGSCGALFVQSLFEKQMGLVIDDDGITYYISATPPGLVRWEDIEEIKIVKIAREKTIMIVVNNPYDYIDKQTNRISRMTMKANYKMCGSPIFISANTLKCNFKELSEIIQRELRIRN